MNKILKFLGFLIISVLVTYYAIQKNQNSYDPLLLQTDDYDEISIVFDKYGIPTINATTQEGTQYALGYLQSKNVLWGLQFNRMIGSGRLSEVFGQKTLKTDIFFRQLGLKTASADMEVELSPRIRRLLQAYADGINYGVEELTILPLEFWILRAHFEKWTIKDSILMYKLQHFSLSADWDTTLLRSQIIELFGETKASFMLANRADALFQETTIMTEAELKFMNLYSPKEHQPEVEAIKEQKHQDFVEPKILDLIVDSKGSNAMVVSGKHTDTGLPILGSDPHLQNQIPNNWYLARISFYSEKLGRYVTSVGGSIPGCGFLSDGKSEYATFGPTTSYLITTSLYDEKIEGDKYFFENQWVSLKKQRNEVIRIKGEADKIINVPYTHRGPIIEMRHLKLSFSWTGYDPHDLFFDCLANFSTITNFKELTDMFDSRCGPSQSVVFATKDNHIGFYVMGLIPLIPKPYRNGLIHDGTTNENDWERLATKEEQPKLIDPEKGFIVVANNKVAPDSILNQLTVNQISTSRAKRLTFLIQELIKKKKKITLEDFKKIQGDVVDSYAQETVPSIVKILKTNQKFLRRDKDYTQYIDLLENWNCEVDVNSIGASIYYVWEYQVMSKLFRQVKDEGNRMKLALSKYFKEYLLNTFAEYSSKGEKVRMDGYCQQDATNTTNCIEILAQSFIDTILYLKENVSHNDKYWKWGKIHRNLLGHNPFKNTPLKYFFNRGYNSKGSSRTIHQSRPNRESHSFDGTWGSNYKMISTFGAVQDPSMFVIDGGQSANIFDPHYDDLMELHEKGEFLLMWPQASSQPKVKIARHKKSEDSKKSLRPEDL